MLLTHNAGPKYNPSQMNFYQFKQDSVSMKEVKAKPIQDTVYFTAQSKVGLTQDPLLTAEDEMWLAKTIEAAKLVGYCLNAGVDLNQLPDDKALPFHSRILTSPNAKIVEIQVIDSDQIAAMLNQKLDSDQWKLVRESIFLNKLELKPPRRISLDGVEKDLTPQAYRKVRQLLSAGRNAEQQFLLSNQGLVKAYLDKRRNRLFDPSGWDYSSRFDDMIHYGLYGPPSSKGGSISLGGVMNAIRKFDWRKGFKFSTYADYWIKMTVQKALKNLSKGAGIVDSLDRPVTPSRFTPDSEDVTLGDLLTDSNRLGWEDYADIWAPISQGLGNLPPDVQKIFLLRLQGYSFNEIAEQIGQKQQNVARKFRKACDRFFPNVQSIADLQSDDPAKTIVLMPELGIDVQAKGPVKTIVSMRKLGLTFQEIAQTLGITLSEAKKRYLLETTKEEMAT